MNFVLLFVQGFTNGFSILISKAFGQKNEVEVKRSIAASTILSIFYTVAITLISCPLTGLFLDLLKIPAEIYNDAYDYLFIILLGTGATIFYNLISNILRALGDSKLPLILLIISSILNIFLDIIFILPLGMGFGGAAIATVLSQLFSAVLCTIIALKRFEELKIEKKTLKV